MALHSTRLHFQGLTLVAVFMGGLASVCASARGQARGAFQAAAEAFAAGDFARSEQLTLDGLKRSPDDPYGLNLLAISLDGERKYREAERVYLEALRRGTNSTILNNLANHYMSVGDKGKARRYYLETLALEPHHSNAHYQIAQMDLDAHEPRQALAHLRSMPGADRDKPVVKLLEAQALFDSGQPGPGRALLGTLDPLSERDASVAFSLGVLEYREKLYPESVRHFETALRQSPGDFDILYNLGLAYHQQGQNERAVQLLGRATKINDRSADAFYHLALVLGQLGRDEAATEALVQAGQLAPERAELNLLLARECQKQEFWLDASEAYSTYLRQKPEDWAARRQLALVYGRLREFDKALLQMNRYVEVRPKDADGHYLRGLILWHLKQSDAAKQDFQRALSLNPNNAEAWARLGEVSREENDLSKAEDCFRRALRLDPRETNALYGLGEILNEQNRYRDAVPVLERAVATRPEEAAPHYQLAIAYRRLGRHDVAESELGKFQRLRGAVEGRKYIRTGLVAYLREGMRLSENERRARELEYLERAAVIRSGDAAILARLLDAYLSEGKPQSAELVIKKWISADGGPETSLKIGEILVDHDQHKAAVPYLEAALQSPKYAPEARLALANAKFQLQEYASALGVLEAVPPPARDLSYDLLRGAIFDKLQRYGDALAAYQQAIKTHPDDERSYLELGLFFVNHQAYDAAIENYRAAAKRLPDSLRIAVAEAIAQNLAGQRQESYEKLRAIEVRWPEQDLPYILAGISAYTAYRFGDARQEFEKAAALESANPLTYYYLALIDSESPEGNPREMLRWAQMAAAGDPNLAEAQLLLGKLYKRLGNGQDARHCLERAIQLQPNLAEAHYLLGRIYAESGESALAEVETRESQRWHREVHAVSPEKEKVVRLLVEIGQP
jgi:tetratricopeptide (TPR) repeat protein